MTVETPLEKDIVLKLFKDFSVKYNASNISKELGRTRVGTFKALKQLEKDRIVIGETLGKARFYKLNLKDEFVRKNVEILLMKESRKKQRWLNELEELFNHTEIIILFGSIIRDEKKAKDIDLLIVLNQRQNKEVNKVIEDKKMILTRKIHPVKQTKQDLINNLNKPDKVILNALKFGVVLHGFENIVKIVQNAQKV